MPPALNAAIVVASFIAPLLLTQWVARRLTSQFVLHGFLVGFTAFVIYMIPMTLSGESQPLIYWIAHAMKILGGLTGGLVAAAGMRARRDRRRPLAGEQRNAFDVRGVGEQIDAAQLTELVAGVDQCARVAGERCHVARDVDDAARAMRDGAGKRLAGHPRPGRIDDHGRAGQVLVPVANQREKLLDASAFDADTIAKWLRILP